MRVGRRIIHAVGFLIFYLKELLVSNLQVAWDIITPRHHMEAGFVAVPLDLSSDWQILLLANLISMTPGTLSLEVSPDRRQLFIHVMYLDDAETFRRRIKHEFERRVREVFG